MELPIDDDELNLIISSLEDNYHSELAEKLLTIKKIRDENPNGPIKKIAREQYNICI